MRFKLKNIRESITTLTRKIGYRYLKEDEEKKEYIFVRPLELGGYPRFHLFLKIDSENNEFIFNLHLDQRRPVYKGATAHAGDYEGEIIEREVERIKKALEK